MISELRLKDVTLMALQRELLAPEVTEVLARAQDGGYRVTGALYLGAPGPAEPTPVLTNASSGGPLRWLEKYVSYPIEVRLAA
jgi:hypothetical protein